MSFKAVDEIYNFDFQDAQIFNAKFGDGISFELEALIVEPENTQNENFTKSYAGTTKVRLVDGRITGGCKDGYKRYDANNKLLEEVDDSPMDEDALKLILKSGSGAYLYAMDANPDSEEGNYSYTLNLEFPSKEAYDNIGGVSYQVSVKFTKAIFEWDKYMNRVQG